MAHEAPQSPPREAKARRGGKISPSGRGGSRKEKINVVSKASLAMFNPAYAMGIEAGPSWCDSPLTNNDDYDSVREWGVGGVAAAAASVGAPSQRSGARTLAGSQAWALAAESAPDANWRNSPTPELEAFTVSDMGVMASAQSSASDLTASSGEEELSEQAYEQAYEPSYEPLAPVYDRRPSLPLFDSDGSHQMPGRSRRGTLSRVQFNASADGEAPKTPKSPGGSSLSRFFTWKRTAKNAVAARNAMPPLPSALDGFPLGDFPAVPQSAPPGITTFEQAASAVVAAARRPSLSNDYARTQSSDSEHEALPSPTRAPPGLPPLDFGTGTYPATALDGKPKISSTHRASRHLGRKHSMPTLREVRRAQSKLPDAALPDVDSVCWDESAQVGMLGSVSTNAPAPVLPPVNLSGSLSPLIPASPSWGSLGQPRSRISSVGRGTARRGTESIYDNLASPKSPKSPTRSGRRNEFIVDEEHNKAYAGVSSKASRRRSRSVGAACAPPRLSRFGIPPVFTPKSPEVATFSPLLNRGAGAARAEMTVVTGMGRGRATVVRAANHGNGTPTQQNVAAFGGEASMLERGASHSGEVSDGSGSGGNDTEVETRQARRVNLNHGRNGTRAVAVASPKLVARSPHLGSAPSRSPLAQQGRFAQAKLVHSKVAQPVVVNVMPPTPDLSNQERDGFSGESAATLVGTAAIIEEHMDSDDDSADESDAYDAVIVEPVPERKRTMASARVAAAARRRDTVIIDQSTWAPHGFGEGGFPPLPYVEKHERKRVVSDAASELSDFSVSSVSSAGADGPFALARSLSSNSLSSAVSSPCASPATRREIMVSSPSRSGSSQSVAPSAASAQLSLYSFGSSASLSSTTTTSTSILDLGIMTPSASEVLLGCGAKLRTPFTLSSAVAGADEPLGEDCDTPKLSGIGSNAPTAFASPIRPAAKLPSPHTTSPHLELDLTQALDLQGLSDEYPATSKNSPVRRGAAHLARIKTSPPKPLKSRARGMAPITPPHTPSRAQTFDAGAMEQDGMGLGLGLDFGGEHKKPASATPALRVVKRSATKDDSAPHAALWGELGFAI